MLFELEEARTVNNDSDAYEILVNLWWHPLRHFTTQSQMTIRSSEDLAV